jgi:hypothetical protein
VLGVIRVALVRPLWQRPRVELLGLMAPFEILITCCRCVGATPHVSHGIDGHSWFTTHGLLLHAKASCQQR